jgi:hypothetical protein
MYLCKYIANRNNFICEKKHIFHRRNSCFAFHLSVQAFHQYCVNSSFDPVTFTLFKYNQNYGIEDDVMNGAYTERGTEEAGLQSKDSTLPRHSADRFCFVNLLLFAICTNTFSKWCKITRGMKRSAQ